MGTVLDFNGNDGHAIDFRVAQATKVFFKWHKVLQWHDATLSRRVQLANATFMSALLWLAETWHPTLSQRSFLDSWAARMVARACRVRKTRDEDPIDFWRRLHAFGHDQLSRNSGGADVQRRRKLHGFAGHLARMDDGAPRQALATRSLAWWRFFQSRGLMKHVSSPEGIPMCLLFFSKQCCS